MAKSDCKFGNCSICAKCLAEQVQKYPEIAREALKEIGELPPKHHSRIEGKISETEH